MASSFPLKNFQPAVRNWIRPMLLISLALHGILFFIPTSLEPEETPEKAPPEETRINLTQLPPVNQPVAQPSPAAPRPPVVARRPSVAVTRSRPSAPPAVQTVRRPSPPPVAPGAASTPAATPSAQNSFLTDFPRYPGAQPGSFGLPPAIDQFSQKTNDAVAQVESFFRQELSTKGYTVQPVLEDPTRYVLMVLRGGTTQFLTLLPNQEGQGTSIILSPQELPDDLVNVGVVSPEEEKFYADLPLPQVNPNYPEWINLTEPERYLSQPNAFYASLGSNDDFVIEPELQSGIERSVLGSGQNVQDVYTTLENQFLIAEYAIEPANEYGGGSLYKVTRDGITGYLSLVPTVDGTGTAIFFWKRSPN